MSEQFYRPFYPMLFFTGEVVKIGEENARFEANNLKLENDCEKLNQHLKTMEEENNKFQENNAQLQNQIQNLQVSVTR